MKYLRLSLFNALMGILLALVMPAFAAPTIFNAPDSGNPGDVVSLQGDSFGASPQVVLTPVGGSPVSPAPTIINNGSNSCQFRIPSSIPLSVYGVQVSSGGASSNNTVYVNAPRPMHADSPEIYSSAAGNCVFHIYGRNLEFSGHTPTVELDDTSNGYTPSYATVTSGSTAYVLNLTAPNGIVAGHVYQVYVSNGLVSGTAGERAPMAQTLTGAAASSTNPDPCTLGLGWGADYGFVSAVYNVTNSAYNGGAKHDGVTNDAPAIQAAINAAHAAGGGEVYFPASTTAYLIALVAAGQSTPQTTDCLTMYGDVVLSGPPSGSGTATLEYGAPSTPATAWSSSSFGYDSGYAIQWLYQSGYTAAQNVSGIRNLTITDIDTTGNWLYSINAQPGIPESMTGQKELFLNNVTFNLGLSYDVVMEGVNQLAIENCTFNQLDNYNSATGGFSGPLFCDYSQNAVISHNTFTYAVGQLDLGNMVNCVFENNTVNRDASHQDSHTNSREIECDFSSDFAVLNNTFDVVNGTLSENNDGETINTQGGGLGIDGGSNKWSRPDEWVGTVSSATSTTLTDSTATWENVSGHWNGFDAPTTNNAYSYYPTTLDTPYVCIDAGTGAGQYRQITGYNATQLTVSPAWTITPDGTSHYSTFLWSGQNFLVDGNTVTGEPRGFEFYQAAFLDVAVVGNTLTNSGGIYVYAEQQLMDSNVPHLESPKHLDPCYHFQEINNTVTDTLGHPYTGTGNPPATVAWIGYVPLVNLDYSDYGLLNVTCEARSNTVNGYASGGAPDNPANTIFVGSNYNSPWAAPSEGIYDYVNIVMPDATGFVDTGIPGILGTVIQANTINECSYGVYLDTAVYESVLWGNAQTGTPTAIDRDDTILKATHASVNTVIWTPNFTLSASPATVPVVQGNAGQSTITVARTGNFADNVTLTYSALPSGVTASFGTDPVTSSPYTSVLTFTVGGSATPGSYPIVVTGTAPGYAAESVTVTVTVTASGTGTGDFLLASVPGNDPTRTDGPYNAGFEFVAASSFSIGALGFPAVEATNAAHTVYLWSVSNYGTTPETGSLLASVSIPKGAAGDSLGYAWGQLTAAKAITSGSAYWITVDEPAGADAWYNINPLPQFNSSLATPVAAGVSGTLGAFPNTYRDQDNSSPYGVTNGAYVMPDFAVYSAPVGDFSLSASQSSLTLTQGGSVIYPTPETVTVGQLNGFTGSVTLSATGLPSGVTASFSPASTTSTSTMTFTATTSAVAGTYTVTIKGVSGSLTHTTTITLVVNGTSWFTSAPPVSDVRSDTTGSLGYEFTASKSFTMTGLGRYSLNGTTQNHKITLWQATSNPVNNGTTATQIASVTITPGSPNDGQGWLYANFSSPVSITSGDSYWILVDETSGGDSWYGVKNPTGNMPAELGGYATVINQGLFQTDAFTSEYLAYLGSNYGYCVPSFYIAGL